MTTVGIVSPGAMGSAVGRALVAGGARVVATAEGRSARTMRLAEGIELVPTLDDVVVAEIVLSVVPPGAAVEVAEAVRSAASRTGTTPLLADLNAIAPATMAGIAASVRKSALGVVDGSISGRPPTAGGSTTIYLSGARASEVAALAAPGIVWTIVGTEIGQASAVKMSTASVYKGHMAVFAQALRAADANGVLGVVLDDLRRAYPDLVGRAPAALQRVASVSGRYVGEMDEIAAAQAAAGLTPALFEAFAAVYGDLSRTALAAVAPEDVDPNAALEDVLERLAPD